METLCLQIALFNSAATRYHSATFLSSLYQFPNMQLFQRFTSEHIGMLFATLAALGFSMKAIFVKLAYQVAPVDAVTLLSLRMAFSFPLFVIMGFAALKGGPALTRRDWGLLVLLGLSGYYGASILDFMGLAHITAGLERLILFTYPTLTILLGVMFLGQSMSRRVWLSLLFCYAGIALVFVNDLNVLGDQKDIWLGAGLVFGSAVSYAFYSAFAEVSIKRIGAMRFSVLAMFVSIIAVQIHFLSVNSIDALIQPASIYVYCMAMAVFSTVLPIVFQSGAIRRIGAARCVLIGTLGPVLTIFFGWWLLAEPFTIMQALGTALVLVGVYQVKRG